MSNGRKWSLLQPTPLSHDFPLERNGDGAAHMTSKFENGKGEFIDREPFNGKATLVRTVWSDITPNSHRHEVAFPDDGAKTWKPNFISALTRGKR